MLHVSEQRLFVRDDHRAKFWNMCDSARKRFDIARQTFASNLDDCATCRMLCAKRYKSTDHSIAPDHRSLNGLAIREWNDQRNDSVKWEIHPCNWSANIKKNLMLAKHFTFQPRHECVR